VVPLADKKEIRFPTWEEYKKELFSKTPSEIAAGSTLGRGAIGLYKGLLAGPAKFGADVGDYLAEKLGLEPSVGKAINEHLAALEETKK
jgi:hypothetical protein